MNYQEALEYIHGTEKFGIKPGLDSISHLLDLMGQPYKSFKSVHIAGTNGKGSTSAFIEAILRAGGYKTGLFTSPYLERFTERIKVGGEEISGEELGRITEYVKGFVDIMLKEGWPHPTEFEIVTAIGFEFFKRKKIDYAVVEVGLGGRLDATNVITPQVAVITSISMDHTDILGKDLESISREKAGIIKEGVPVVLYPQSLEVAKVIEEVCSLKKAPFFYLDENEVSNRYASIKGQTFDVLWQQRLYKNLIIRMLGKHQIYNAFTAVAAVFQLGLSERAVREGLKRAVWPGRMEVLNSWPPVIIDGAHNVDGAKSLVEGLNEIFTNKKILLVFGILKDKEVHKVAGILASYANRVITTLPDSPRSMHPEELLQVVKEYNPNAESTVSIIEAVDRSMNKVEEDEVIVFAGSLYMIGEVRRLLPPEIFCKHFGQGRFQYNDTH